MPGANQAPSRESLELVKSALAAWNTGGVDAFADHLTEDVVWHEVSGRPESEGSEQVGRERLRLSLESLLEAWETYRIEVERIDKVGERVLAVVREVGRGRSSGVEIGGRWGYLATVENGRIARIDAYRDPELALRAVGLSG